MATDISSVPITEGAWIQHVKESRSGKQKEDMDWDDVASNVDADRYICTLRRSTGGSKVRKFEFTNPDGHTDTYFYINDVQFWIDDDEFKTVNVCLQKVKGTDDQYKICGFAAHYDPEDTQDVEVNDKNAQGVKDKLEELFRR